MAGGSECPVIWDGAVILAGSLVARTHLVLPSTYLLSIGELPVFVLARSVCFCIQLRPRIFPHLNRLTDDGVSLSDNHVTQPYGTCDEVLS